MSYITVRRYAGQVQGGIGALVELIEQQLWPQLREGGCQRYTAVEFSDDKVGSVSLYADKAAAERGNQIAASWVKSGPMANLALSQSLAGERVFTFNRETGSFADTHGVMRLYNSAASPRDVTAALEHEGKPIMEENSALLRYSAFRVDGREQYCILTAHKTSESARALTNAAKMARGKTGSQLNKVLPTDPDVTEGHILRTFSA